jgi:hypothetical protein
MPSPIRTTPVSDTWSKNDWDIWRAMPCAACRLLMKMKGLKTRCFGHKPEEEAT